MIPAKVCMFFDEKDVTHSYLEKGVLRAFKNCKKFESENVVWQPGVLERVGNVVDLDQDNQVVKRYILCDELSLLYCIGFWKIKPKLVQLVNCHNKYVLQPNQCVLVIEGSVAFTDKDSYTANQLTFIKERSYPVELIGKAKLIRIVF